MKEEHFLKNPFRIDVLDIQPRDIIQYKKENKSYLTICVNKVTIETNKTFYEPHCKFAHIIGIDTSTNNEIQICIKVNTAHNHFIKIGYVEEINDEIIK